MLGDHYYSSQPNDHQWKTSIELYANTDPSTKARKQKLDEHLVNVAKVAVNTVKLLPFLKPNRSKLPSLASLHLRPTRLKHSVGKTKRYAKSISGVNTRKIKAKAILW